MEIICLGLGLMILIVVNIVLGSLSAIFQNEFCPIKLRRGIIKAGIVAVCFAATYLVGYLNPNIVAVEVNGVQVSVKTGIDLVVLVGYYHYAKQVIEKLADIIKGDLFTADAPFFNGNGKRNSGNTDLQKAEPSEPNTADADFLPEISGGSGEDWQEMLNYSGLDNYGLNDSVRNKSERNMGIIIYLYIFEDKENGTGQTDSDIE